MKQPRKKFEHSKTTAEDPNERIDFKSILKDIQFIGSPHMTWKEKKALENKKVVALGGKSPKKHRQPLSVARVMMKKQKEREKKELEESLILRRFGINTGSSTGRDNQRRKPEDRVLKSSVGDFRNGVLNVRNLLQPSTSTAPVPHEKKFAPYKGGKKRHGGNKKKGKKGKRH
ncbi:unnamed protein product [Cuscuta campestris]|uniref:Uncharacterized protein n=1 Tax=Cuscuta campestris TaxID=132261 RepID=A0A484L864_9ASTE|nr:unnamed protein product [Cuscuta campestris]